LLLGVYLMAAFDMNLGKILVEGLTNGAMLIKNLFTQVLH